MRNPKSKTLPKVMVRKLSPEITAECDRALAAETVPFVDGFMVYHPALQHLGCGGFFSDLDECAEMLAQKPDLPKRFKVYCFATTAECCQGLDVTDLIESASQDMFEDWMDRVESDCAEEIKIAQATLDALHKRFMDFPTFRVDYSRVHILPVKVAR